MTVIYDTPTYGLVELRNAMLIMADDTTMEEGVEIKFLEDSSMEIIEHLGWVDLDDKESVFKLLRFHDVIPVISFGS